MQETWERRAPSLSQEDPPEKEMAALSSIPAWRIPWTEEPGVLRSMWSHRVGPHWAQASTSSSSHSAQGPRCPSTLLQMQDFFSYGWIIFHRMCVCVCVCTYVEIKYHIIHSPPTVLLIQVFNSFSLGAFAQRANPEFLGRAFLMGCHNCRIAGKKEFPQYMIFVF